MAATVKGLPAGSPLFENHYDCPCGNYWEDVWDSGCDDDCSSCGKTISPTESIELEQDA